MASSRTTAETAATLLQTSHLNPADLSALLVRNEAQMAGSVRRTGVQFGVSVHGFSRMSRDRNHHCLHWSSEETMRPPAVHFPLVDELLCWEAVGDLRRVVSKNGTVSLFSLGREHQRFLGFLRLVRGTDGVYRKSIIQEHKCWSFQSQVGVVREDGYFGVSTAQAMELLSKKLVMWLFSHFSVVSGKQLALRQLEMAFPLIAVMHVDERRRFISNALNQFAGRLLSFYDDRVIYLTDVSVNALSLLSPMEFSTVTSMEHASVAFVFRCHMRHDEVLEALQIIINSWGKSEVVVLASKLVRQAVAVLLSHAATTHAFQQSHGLKGCLRLFVIRHMPSLLLLLLSSFTSRSSSSATPSQLQQPTSVGGLLASRLITMLRSSKQKESVLASLQEDMEQVMCSELVATQPTLSSIIHDAGSENDVGYIFNSVTPLPRANTGCTTWKIFKASHRYTVVSLPDAPAVKNSELDGTAADLLFCAALFSGARVQLSRPLLKCDAETELCLNLNLGKVVTQPVSDDEEKLWRTSRKRGRPRKQV